MHRLAAAVLLLAGCSESAPPDIATTREEVKKIINDYHAELTKGDAEAAAACLAPDAAIVNGGEDPVYGKEACTALLKKFVDIYKEKDILGKRSARFGEIRVEVKGGIATATYPVTFLEPAGPFNECYTQSFIREGKSWLLWREHRSARLPR